MIDHTTWENWGDCHRAGCAGAVWADPASNVVRCDSCGGESYRGIPSRVSAPHWRSGRKATRKAPKTGAARDQQRGRVYAAERAAGLVPDQPHYATLPEVVGLLHHVMTQRWFRARWSLTIDHIDVEDGRGQRFATCTGTLLELPRWSRSDGVILHELAHALAADRHGPQFARAYLTLVRYAIGKDAADTLRARFRDHRVKVGAPRPVRAVPKPPAKRSVWVQLPTDLADRIDARVPTDQRAAFYEAALREGLRRFRLAKTTAEKQLVKAARAKR